MVLFIFIFSQFMPD